MGASLEVSRAFGLWTEAHLRGMTYRKDGHAAFVNDAMDLRCRHFHQYPFYRASQLAETIDCARREMPLLVLVTTSFYDPMPGRRAWEAFVAGTRSLLASRYELVTEEGMSQVWRRRPGRAVAD